MKNSFLAALAITILMGGSVRAAESGKKGGVAISVIKPTEKKKNTFESWLMDLKKRVARTRARPNQLVAVAAVRGSEQDMAPKLYWKGKKGETIAAADELDDFEKAVDSAISGEPDAQNKLQKFLSTYPKSSYAADAHTALDRITAGESAAK